MARTRIVSLGYEGRTPAELLRLLAAEGVTRLLDVRELPLSRRKGFSKTPLSAALTRAGIEYRHLPAAGNPHRRSRAPLVPYRRRLRQHPEIVRAVAAELAPRTAVLCVCREHERCHRSVLLAELSRRRPLQILALE